MSFKIKSRIFIKQWMNAKPYESSSKTDIYYLSLCNRVRQNLKKNSCEHLLGIYLDETQISEFCCLLVSYFEDVISETNVWKSFIDKHEEIYGRLLPFYDTTEYTRDEINVQDVRFLVWYFMSTMQSEKYFDPLSGFMLEAAKATMEVFEEEFETAPENELLKSYYTLPETADYYEVRHFMQVVLLGTYLFKNDTEARYLMQVDELLNSSDEIEDIHLLENYLNDLKDNYTLFTCTKLLSLRSNEWVAAILGKEHPLHDAINDIPEKINAWFLYKGQNRENIFLEHVATGVKFEMTKDSYEPIDTIEEESIMYAGLVQWKGEWWLSGIIAERKFDADLILEERNSIEARKTLASLEDKDLVRKTLDIQREIFLQYNGNNTIAFMDMDNLDAFLNGFHRFYTDSLQLSEKAKAKKRAAKEGFFRDAEEINFPMDEDTVNVVVFFNPNSGVEIYHNLASAFPTKANRFYKEEEKDSDFVELLYSETCSTEIAQYCYEHYKDEYEFFARGLLQITDDQFDFLLRFIKESRYHTKPEVTFLGATGK